MDSSFFKAKNVLIMGLGNFEGGTDAARFAYKKGANVTVTDLADENSLSKSIAQLNALDKIRFHLSGHNEKDFARADVVIVNPAVPPDNAFINIAKTHNALITSQIEIFFELCPAAIIAITGSNGKSTTTALTAHILQNTLNTTTWLAGNIGNKPLLDILDQIEPDHFVVLELSSFQLEQLANIKKSPHISLLTNLTPNHLDRHKTFQNYCDAKENIFKFNSPISIFNADDKIAAKLFEKYSADKDRICKKFSASDVGDDLKRNFALPGNANLQNLAAALTVAKLLNIPSDKINAAVSTFKSLPHRLEFVSEIAGVKWYNDSIATTPESVIVAIEAFAQPKIIIAGGYDKKISFKELAGKMASLTKAVVLIGQTAKKIADDINSFPNQKTQIRFADSLEDAVTAARSISAPGDVVLLSPACASYDMFKNFQHRGELFKTLVKNLK